jgi:hypothetical protein
MGRRIRGKAAVFLKNYTSDVAPSITIGRIKQLLIRVGCSSISESYGSDGEIQAITFTIQIPGAARPMMIRIPSNVEGALTALWLNYADGGSLSHNGNEVWGNGRKRRNKKSFRDQAQRTAWRLAQDWIEVQISMIQMQQADILQVFLPYAWDGKQTYYDRLKGGGFKALLPPDESSP